jgi:hypothetical protein
MRRISPSLLIAMLFMLVAVNAFAKTLTPAFIVTPFSKSVSLAPNSSATVLVVAQNNSGVNQTITNIMPNIPANSGISGTVTNNSCGFLSPGTSCEALVELQSSTKPSSGTLNISMCAFNGTFCSHIVKPINFANNHPVLILVSPTNSSIANGTTQQYTAIGFFANTTIQNITNSVHWSSSNTSTATISNASGAHGLATGVAAGNSTISATLDGVSGSTALTVTNATLTSITVTPTNLSVPNISTQQYTAVGIFSDNSSRDLTSLVTWNSSNPTAATISNAQGQKGVATTKNVGATTISATFGAVSGTTPLNVTAAVLTTISVTPTNPSISIDTLQQFEATGIYSDNSVKDLTNLVSWSTQSTLVAIISNQIDSKGKALGVGVGSTGVIARLGDIVGATTLLVTPAELISIDIAPININLHTGSEQQYVATGIYSNGRTQDITTSAIWQSSNPNIASISNAPGSEGLAFAIQPGTVAISASSELIVASTHLTVDTPALLSITVTPTTPTIANGTQQQFIATGNYSDLSTKDLTAEATWLSSAPSIAVISNTSQSKGLATTQAVGSTIITAAFNGVNGNTTLTVSAATLTSIAVTPANPSIPDGTNAQFTATGTYSNLSTKIITNEVTWVSLNPAIATISNAASSQGLATGVHAGSTTINAIASGVTGGTTLTVISAHIGDSLQGGKIACLDGGLNNLIAANSDNSNSIVWGGNGIITNAQSLINGTTNTAAIVTALGPGITYAAGLCDAYEIDSAGNTPCVGGNTCYNDWFLPAINQLTCLRSNRNQIGGFTRNNYWSSTADANQPATKAFSLNFRNNGQNPDSSNKTDVFPVRCVRIINAAL